MEQCKQIRASACMIDVIDAVAVLHMKNIGSMKAMGLPIWRYLCSIVAHIKMEHTDVRS